MTDLKQFQHSEEGMKIEISYGIYDCSKPVFLIEPSPCLEFRWWDLFWAVPLCFVLFSFFAFAVFFYWHFPQQAIAWIPVWILASVVGFLMPTK